MKEAHPVHEKVPITTMAWNPQGTRFISCDANGLVAAWRMDTRGRLISQIQQRPGEEISKIAFVSKASVLALPDPPRREKKKEKEAASPAGDDAFAEDADAHDILLRGRNFSEDCLFACGGKAGRIHLMDDLGNLILVLSPNALDGTPINALLWYPQRCGLVLHTEGQTLAFYVFNKHFIMDKVLKVKISTNADDVNAGANTQVLWIGPGLLCTSGNENVLRVWNLERDENYMLSLSDQDDDLVSRAKGSAEVMSCVSFNGRKRVLAGGTKEGRIVFWQYVGANDLTTRPSTQEDWEAFAEIDLETAISDISWGPGETLLAARLEESVSILHETVLKRKLAGQLAIVQMSPECVAVEHIQAKTTQTVKSGLRIKGLDLYGNHFAVYNGKQAELYEIKESANATLLKAFPCEAHAVALHAEGVFLAKKHCIEVLTYSLTRKQVLSFTDQEGGPLHMDINKEFLAVATRNNYLRMWKIGRDCRPMYHAKQIFERIDKENVDHEITSIRTNCKGTKVSVLVKLSMPGGVSQPDTRFHVVDLEEDKYSFCDFQSSSRFPMSHCWDDTESKLVGVETRRFGVADVPADGDMENDGSTRIEVATLFASTDKGVMIQDSFPLDRSLTALIGLSVPQLYFYARFKTDEGEGDTHIETRPMRDFEGIDIQDTRVREALLNFSYYLTVGNMDEARRAVKQIKDDGVWRNMAVMCVKTKRLDVAEQCLGYMEDAKASKALRDVVEQEPDDKDAQVAALAIQLGRVDDAEKLYKQARRFDLLVKLYTACGKWDLALQTTDRSDRIHLRSVHYQYARHLEAIGDVDAAIKQYELSQNHRYELPRMLYDLQRLPQLELYIQQSKDKELVKWWAQYCESNKHYDVALDCYLQAGDILSCCRLYCFLNNHEKGAELVNSHNHPAAAYHLARQREDQGAIEEAIHYFTIAKAYRHAIRLAKDCERHQDIMNLALKCNRKPVLLDAGEYFNQRNKPDKAVLLFQKGGQLAKALDICISGKMFSELDQIASGMEPGEVDAETCKRAADFLSQNGHHEKAVNMLIQARQYDKALEICVNHDVSLTEEKAESMEVAEGTPNAAEVRTELFKNIAKVAKSQKNYQLSCKYFTKAGEKMKAMKVLLQSGDREKICFFAMHSRQREIYILSANFLQNLDWHSDPEIMKNIISFYTKAKAFDQLAAFYDACAQHEINEFRDYDKALAALKESKKTYAKAKGPEKEGKVVELTTRLDIVEKFVTARKMVKTDPMAMVRMCNELLDDTPDVDEAIRVGDVYALLVEFYLQLKEPKQAYSLITKMKTKNIPLSYYLDRKLVAQVYAAVGETNDDYDGGEAYAGGMAEEAPDERDVNFDDEVVDDD
eukprot:NODE_7_length_4446_cov_23.596543_g6_i0.p1 GENE.NODE_7_length_4446_cov_23.596543_g6_i0~~NODE_7_length_4446_cov_23.596543_g6_i0.p1  ORF type:complete len:1437 (-),score=556.32 NODE_7_length_4446_cov_23.596543_g6_i0:134-4204(-)